MSNHRLTIKQLDRQLKAWRALSVQYGRPKAGWVKTLREALCMTAEQLGTRLGVTRGRVAQLEDAEINDAVTLRALKNAAHAMGCELVYAIVPKKQTSLEALIRAQIERFVDERVGSVHHTMLLENQALDAMSQTEQKQYFIEQLERHLSKDIWENLDSSVDKDVKKRKHLMNALKKILQNPDEKK
ncbi:MAG TPA: mobile mystery protein A [Gammaproteobacteria bacterium]|jgi:predicted DNA-binding mobile mystery protein A|nr:mobile mystery protein A [Gammaproteobacteria bacterium]